MWKHKFSLFCRLSCDVCAACVLLALIGCLPSEAAQQGTSLSALDGTRWRLTSLVDTNGPLSIPAEPIAYLEFEDDRLSFSVGCNPMVGDYSSDGKQLKVTFVAHQLIDCGDSIGDGAMNLERAFANSLPTWSTYDIENDELRIDFDGGQARFQRDTPSGTPTASP